MCAPNRPPVTVSVVPIGNGALQVTVSAQTLDGSAPNMLNGVRFGTAVNARVDAGTVTNAAGNFTAAAQAGSQQMSFQVRQGVLGQAATVPLVVMDGCGEWPTLVGGGSSAFVSPTPTATPAPMCGPTRPPVDVSVTPSGAGSW